MPGKTAASSNSRSSAKFGTNGKVAGAGVDTWSVAWYLGEGSAARKTMEAMATDRAARSMMLPDKVAGHRVGWFPGSALMFAEGHPARRSDGGVLCPSDQLPEALESLTAALLDVGISVPGHREKPEKVIRAQGAAVLEAMGAHGFAGIRRLDSTVDLHFEDGREGLAALAGVAALALPRCKTEVIREVGGRRVETVYLRGSSGRRVLGRWYDKGIESRTAARGLRIRPEDQRRFSKACRLDVEAVASSSYVRDAFVRRFEPLWRAAKGVKVAGPAEISIRLAEMVDEGLITPLQAVRMAGHIQLADAGVAESICTRRTYMRHRGEVRDHGLVLADGVDDEIEVDLGEVLERALDSEAWGSQG